MHGLGNCDGIIGACFIITEMLFEDTVAKLKYYTSWNVAALAKLDFFVITTIMNYILNFEFEIVRPNLVVCI